jgi:hypothetical protein
MFNIGSRRVVEEQRNRVVGLEADLRREQERVSQLEAEVDAMRAEMHALRENTHLFQVLSERLRLFGDSAVQVQGSMAKLAVSLKQERSDAIKTTSTLDANAIAVERISANLRQLADRTSLAAHKVGDLTALSAEIGGIVHLIKEVADQTNLLALNAAIEAARAGEQGRGFAVVADEVRKLAERTTQATAQISSLVGKIQGETAVVCKAIELDPEQSAQFIRDGDQASSSMRGLLALNQTMASEIAAEALRTFVETAKLDHLVYKFEIYKVFLGVSTKTAREFADHADCRLGKWYYGGDGRHCFSHLPGYRELEQPHIAVHRQGTAALDNFASGNTDAAVADLQGMEEASQKVLDQLERMAVSGQDDRSLLCMNE